MKNISFKQYILDFRSFVMKAIKPKEKYYMATRNLKPISTKFGFDRGTPIDRYWIESFIAENQKFIKGHVLEIGDNRYTQIFGGPSVTRGDVLDIDTKNTKANIHGDLTALQPIIKNDTYDCIILTHVLGMIPDYEKAVSEIHRILKPGGTLLLTSSCFSPTYDIDRNYWRFTTASMRYILTKYFSPSQIRVQSYGNVLAGQYFWVGLSQEELTQKELEYNDRRFACIVTACSTK